MATRSEDELHQEALAQGYKDETCSECKMLFLAHKHLIRCDSTTCPMKDGKGTLLEQLVKETEAAESLSPCCGAEILIGSCERHIGALDLNHDRPRCAVCQRYVPNVCAECQEPISKAAKK